LTGPAKKSTGTKTKKVDEDDGKKDTGPKEKESHRLHYLIEEPLTTTVLMTIAQLI
jgi:hypothetical protein